MDRRSILFSLFDASGFGLEIGPSHNPLLPKTEGYRVETVDHLDKDALIEKYGAAGLDTSRIEDVDFVADGRSLVDLTGRAGCYDFVVASHVIEHVPDMLGFLKDCEALLKPDGVLVLAVPDKRCCFDAFQRLSSTGEVAEAHRIRRTRPGFGSIFDDVAYGSCLDGAIGWPLHAKGQRSFFHAFARAFAVADEADRKNLYRDVHVWHFVPASFRLIVNDLYEAGALKLRETAFLARDEFFVALSRTGRGSGLSRVELCEAVLREQSLEDEHVADLRQEVAGVRRENDLLLEAIERKDDAIRTLEASVAVLQRENERNVLSGAADGRRIDELSQTLDAIQRSTSWQVTAPVRAVVRRLRGR